ncbi:probable galacturonosyltransferase 3 [Prosopis cineraria]|uniref:probable galacturonosyltransferase 3 n=1 Tax=Prosopis cineraria TaxID=364024 RepID=UPI00240F84E7|nr:probable galacturonosyltransferase 3 [Prosopis cineraria]
MPDQRTMAKGYTNIAMAKNKTILYNALINTRESQLAIGEGSSELLMQSFTLVARNLRVMLQSTEESVNLQKKRSAFFIQLAAITVPRPLPCLPLQPAADYFLLGYHKKGNFDKEKIEDPSLYHYAILSDNVLDTSVVVNCTVHKAKEPEKHVFNIVTIS